MKSLWNQFKTKSILTGGMFILGCAVLANSSLIFSNALADEATPIIVPKNVKEINGVYPIKVPKDGNVIIDTRIEAVEPPPPCKPTPCSPCPPKSAGSALLIGMVGIGGAAGIGLRPRRSKEEKEQEINK
ncbi:MAG: hypothetical protein ACOYL3_10560 [Desulfuromonadaceae bacterium]